MNTPVEKPHRPVSAQAAVHDDVQKTLTIAEAEQIIARQQRWRRTFLVATFGIAPLVTTLAAFAIPTATQWHCRARQSDVRTNLKAVYIAQETYRGENDTYHQDLALTGFVPGFKDRYWYEVVDVGPHHFEARAIGKPNTEVAGDVWTIDQDNVSTNVRDVCAAR